MLCLLSDHLETAESGSSLLGKLLGLRDELEGEFIGSLDMLEFFHNCPLTTTCLAGNIEVAQNDFALKLYVKYSLTGLSALKFRKMQSHGEWSGGRFVTLTQTQHIEPAT